MSETPTSGLVGAGSATPAPETSAGTTDAASGGTGNPADAAPIQSNPTDSSSVSDEQGVQPERAEQPPNHTEDVTVPEHEGTGPGDDVDNLPPSNTTADVEDEVDGSDNA